jgi:hypothetical protein
MEFYLQGQQMKLCGDDTALAHPLSPAGFNKMVTSGGVSSCHMCLQATLTTTNTLSVDNNTEQQAPFLVKLLDQFQDVFVEPIGLPPPRSTDHYIPLHPSIEAVDVRPYHYPHFQKNEIEKQVSKLLKTGVIRLAHLSAHR